jgi:hypothetical protein
MIFTKIRFRFVQFNFVLFWEGLVYWGPKRVNRKNVNYIVNRLYQVSHEDSYEPIKFFLTIRYMWLAYIYMYKYTGTCDWLTYTCTNIQVYCMLKILCKNHEL